MDRKLSSPSTVTWPETQDSGVLPSSPNSFRKEEHQMMRARPCLAASLLFLISVTIASATVGVYPAGITFPSQTVGTTGPVQYVTLYNVGTNTFTVNTDSINQSVFKIVAG